MLDFSALVGKTLTQCWSDEYEVHFIVSDDESYKIYHEQDCCENVYVESVDGDLDDLIGTPILMAEESTNCGGGSEHEGDCQALNEYEDSFTWTFYRLATIKGYVTIRFYGSSNGYYSESVYFTRT